MDHTQDETQHRAQGPSSQASEEWEPHPFAAAQRSGGATATSSMFLDDDDEMVGVFARETFTPGTGPRVNLMPAEIVGGRRVERAQRRGLLALVVVLAVVVAAYVLVSGERSMARDDLAATQADTARLTSQQARYARAPQVYSAVASTQEALSTAMADDVSWYQYLADLPAAAPPGLWLTSWSVSMPDAATAAATTVDPTTTVDPATTGTPPLAALTIGGSSLGEDQVPDWLEILDRMPGLDGAYASSLTRTAVDQTPVFTFESSTSVTSDALSQRYTTPEK